MDKRAKTLVILAPAFAGSEADSKMPSQEILVRTINRLDPSLKIVILTFHYPVREDKEYNWFGNRVITFNGAMKGKLHSPLLWLRVWKKLQQLNRQYKLAGLFSFFCSECAFVGHYFAMRHKLKHYIWVMGQDARSTNNQVRRIKPLPEELVTISDFLQTEFEQSHGIRPAHIIPIGVSTSLFHNPVVPRDIDIMGAGSLIPLKQYDQFADVVKMITDALGKMKVVLVGNGPEENIIRSKLSELQIAQQVTLTGKLSQQETINTMQRSKVLLHTSAYEGLGMVCLEALYAGAHVISFCKPFDAGIPHWHIVNTKEEMAAKAIELLSDLSRDHSEVLPFNMEDTALDILGLFNIYPLPQGITI